MKWNWTKEFARKTIYLKIMKYMCETVKWNKGKRKICYWQYYGIYCILLSFFSIYYQYNIHVYWYENTTFDSQEWWRRKINKVIRVTERKHPFFILVHIYMMMSIYALVLPISSFLEWMLIVSENANASRILIILAYHVEFEFTRFVIVFLLSFLFFYLVVWWCLMLNKNEIQFISPLWCDRYSGLVLCTYVYP